MSNEKLFLGLFIIFSLLSVLVGIVGIKDASKQRNFWITTFALSNFFAGGALAMLINPRGGPARN